MPHRPDPRGGRPGRHRQPSPRFYSSGDDVFSSDCDSDRSVRTNIRRTPPGMRNFGGCRGVSAEMVRGYRSSDGGGMDSEDRGGGGGGGGRRGGRRGGGRGGGRGRE
ncbi:hypothetical protein P171DRAFT_514501 [Karstenula rhodostoma CBS 690.94]|uniref:Uncharacterized protein n=1 Tax=Karstenula rhodostoma CBS 690.94 TaxID=1392251 RepID=A0A9P4UCH2_9PLEO|nr:hypothetical protein P171DRAFT_514501 [Karstenula rhodostoma CBS 690.94]